MTTRLGKIAQLSKSIRNQLNCRLENGQQSPELLRWLNGLPQTKKLLAKKFDNQPITKSNLSDWRHGGYQDWLADQAREARIQRISESGATLQRAETGDLFEDFARIAVAELMADFDSLHKLRGEDRSRNLHNLVRDLARLQNSFNRSRWAELAWTKYNERFLGPDDYEEKPTPAPEPSNVKNRSAELYSAVSPSCTRQSVTTTTVPQLETRNSKPETQNATSCPSTSVVPDGTQSQGRFFHDPEQPYNPIKLVYHTRCECGEPCPQCHASDSEYPLDEVLRDKQYYKKYGRNPHDRHGNSKYLMNCDCDCFCDRCTPVAQAFQPAGSGDFPVPGPQTPPPNEPPAINPNPPPSLSPLSPLSPISSVLLADFSRRMALLKSASQ